MTQLCLRLQRVYCAGLEMAGDSLEWIVKMADLLQPSDIPDHLHRPDRPATPASVLIPVFYSSAEWHVLYIRRVTNERDRHSGQVAFPGGRRDDTDSTAVEVALREAHEEVGLDRQDVSPLGQLDTYHTSSNFIVTPVVGVIPYPYDFVPQTSEVDRIFSIPLSFLSDQQNIELRDRQFPSAELRRQVELKVVYFRHYDGEKLWGATARMTLQFLRALRDGKINLPPV